MAKNSTNNVMTGLALVVGITSLIFSIVAASGLLRGLKEVSDASTAVKNGMADVVDRLALLDADQVTDCLMGGGGVAHIARWCQFAHTKGLVTTVASSPRQYEPTQKGKDLVQALNPDLVTNLLTRVDGRPDDSIPQYLAALNLRVLNSALLDYKTEHDECTANLQDVLAVLAAYLAFPAPA